MDNNNEEIINETTYKQNNITLYNNDCMQKLKDIELNSIRAIISDFYHME